MPSFLLLFAGKLGIPEPLRKAAVIATGIALLIAVFGVAKCSYDRSVIRDHEAKIEQRAKPATDQAASERANDAIANSKHEEELHNAVHSVPDAPPAGPSHALACKRLHDLGRNPPACR